MGRVQAGTAIGLWAIVVVTGTVLLTRYSLGPGRAATPPARWPAASVVAPAANRATLVLIAHPRCACTRATLGELSLLMTHCAGRLSAHVIFVRPAGAAAGWTNTDVVRSAKAIPGVTVTTDDNGVEADRFGTWTSGQVMLYDASGRLEFCGGITAGRGHAGDNAGRSAIEALLHGGQVATASAPVFGCKLFADGTAHGKEVVPECPK